MRFRRVSTHFVGFAGNEDMAQVKQDAIESLNTGRVVYLEEMFPDVL